jgi:hypothetical protein
MLALAPPFADLIGIALIFGLGMLALRISREQRGW